MDSVKLPYAVSTLVFIQNKKDEFLMLKRAKSPNKGCWSPIGGKLEMAKGESPFQCAIRETREEAGLEVTEEDLHMFSMVTEKAYEGTRHWLMFMFLCKKRIENLPAGIKEGDFSFFSRNDIQNINIPKTDHLILWDVFDKYHKSFIAMRAESSPDKEILLKVEQAF